MKDKEKLLALDTPLKFIFSHSALKEGWDNPNVFQICTLREIGSERERRQTIGRGLRLCVDQHGERVRGFEVNRLTVIATEPYEQFAGNLQKEIEAETGIRFGLLDRDRFASLAIRAADGTWSPLGGERSLALWDHLVAAGYIDAEGKVRQPLRHALASGHIVLAEAFEAHRSRIAEVLRKLCGRIDIRNADERRLVSLRRDSQGKAVYLSDDFGALWDRIKYRTTYRVQFDNARLLEDCIAGLRQVPPPPEARLQWRKADIAIGRAGVAAIGKPGASSVVLEEPDFELPDLLTELQDRTRLTRRSIATILTGSGRLEEFRRNPQQFIEQAAEVINRCKRLAMAAGIEYRKIGEDHFHARERFAENELTGYLRDMLVDARRSIHEHVVPASAAERDFAEALEGDDGVVLYARLPAWFEVPTPFGPCNPAWAILFDRGGAERLYVVAETPCNPPTDEEIARIQCARAHFAALGTGENPARYVAAASWKNALSSMT
jgi:type III restriction enzyme